MQTYFKYVNARRGPDGKRGVYGRGIIFKTYDDGYNPAQAVQLHNKLVLQDKVFAIVGTLGTENNLAIRPMLNARKIPQILVSTGASYWGLQYKQFPWTSGWQTDYVAEGRIYARWLRANKPNGRIAILYQNDDYGKDYLYGVKYALGDRYVSQNLATAEPFEVTATSVASQMTRIRATGAPIFVILATPTPTIRAYATGKALGYNPEQIYLNSVSATAAFLNVAVNAAGAQYVNGSLSVAYLKDPSSPTWTNDAAMKQYREIMAKYAPSANANDGLYFYGVAKAEAFVQALYKAGKNPTRAGLMNALLTMNATNKFALPGVMQKTSRTDRFIISQMQLIRYTHPDWVRFGQIIEGRPGSK
jgi:branched-chain amino acid transport system substrate-binding protein